MEKKLVKKLINPENCHFTNYLKRKITTEIKFTNVNKEIVIQIIHKLKQKTTLLAHSKAKLLLGHWKKLYVCVHMCMCTCMYVCMCVCEHVCMCVCVYVCMCVFKWENHINILVHIKQRHGGSHPGVLLD